MRYHFYVPENLDLDAVLETQNFMQISAFHKDKLCFILNTIAEKPSWYKDMILEDGYVCISGKTMQNWIGRDYKKYIDLLINATVIETDNRWILDEKSKGYRYCSKYNGAIKKVLVTDNKLIKKLTEYATKYNFDYVGGEDNKQVSSKIQSQYINAVNWYRSGLIKIDHELAHRYNQAVFDYKRRDKGLWDKEVNGSVIKLKNPGTQYKAAHISIDKIHSGRFNEHPDSNVYRLHSVITQCKREIRNAITIDGQEVVAVDLSNSQPTLLTLLIDYKFWEGVSSFNHTQIPYLNTTNMFNTKAHYTSFIKMCKSAEHNSDIAAEIQRFKDLVASGKFYDTFRSLLEHKLSTTGLSKQDVKTMFFTVLFTSNHFIGQEEAAPKRVFREWFPYIYELCRMIKVKDHANLPILLQRIESYIMFSKIIARISYERPNLPFIPIHDSIAATVGNEDYVETVMKEELNKCLGFTPNFKKEYWKSDVLESMIGDMNGLSIAA